MVAILARKMLRNISDWSKLYFLHITEHTTKHLFNQGNFKTLICVCVINRGKSEIFEWNTLIKQMYLVWKKEESLVEVTLLNRETLLKKVIQVIKDLKTFLLLLLLLLLLFLNLFKIGQIYNSVNIFTIQYIITNQNRLTKKIN